MHRMAKFCLAASASAGTALAYQATAPQPGMVRQSFDLQVPHPPALVPVGDDHVLRYELHLTNFASQPLAVDAVSIMDPAQRAPIDSLEGDRLNSAIAVAGAGAEQSDSIVPPGGRAILYVDLELGARAPTALHHRVSYKVAESPEAHIVTGGQAAIDARPLPLFGPPLRSGPWVAVYDPQMERGHRRVHYAVGGRARIPGRHAIDWMAPGAAESPRGRGAEVLAVADGIIVAARDGIPEPEPGKPRPRVTLQDATGNYVALALGDGRFAFYEHLMPGLKVRRGDRVRRGDVLGLLGSTGQASRPHLHFHVSDANSPLAAEGLPFAIRGMRVKGLYASIAAFEGGGPWSGASQPAACKTSCLPPPQAVVEFDAPSR